MTELIDCQCTGCLVAGFTTYPGECGRKASAEDLLCDECRTNLAKYLDQHGE